MEMQYLIFVGESEPEDVVLTAAVGPEEVEYMRTVVIPELVPLSENEYVNGPLAIHVTAARFSYILAGSDVYWCVEWSPGLLVLRFSSDSQIHWCSLRSPVPGFGGRDATDEEWDTYDEDAPDPQYNLIFDCWDHEDAQDQGSGWHEATESEVQLWRAAMARSRQLGQEKWNMHSSNRAAYEQWLEGCKSSRIWQGDTGGANLPN